MPNWSGALRRTVFWSRRSRISRPGEPSTWAPVKVATRSGLRNEGGASPLSTSPASACRKHDVWRRRRGVEVNWIEADLRSYSPAQRAFDLVVLVYIHLPGEERRAVVRRAADAVAAGGTLLVIGHDRSNIEEGYGGPQDPTILFSPDDISR